MTEEELNKLLINTLRQLTQIEKLTHELRDNISEQQWEIYRRLETKEGDI